MTSYGSFIGWWGVLLKLNALDQFRASVKDMRWMIERLPAAVGFDPDTKSDLVRRSYIWRELCESEGLRQTLGILNLYIRAGEPPNIHQWPHLINCEITKQEAIARLEQVLESLEQDIHPRAMFILGDGKPFHYEYIPPVEIRDAFPSAVPELKQARKCFALELYTGSVFHHMRAMDLVLKASVEAIGVTTPNIPLSEQDWNPLILKFECEGEKIIQAARGKVKAREFFNGVAADFYHFKDAVRNITMHAQNDLYREPEAMGIMLRVNDCLAKLAVHVGEDGEKPVITTSNFP